MKINKLVLLSIFISFSVINNAYPKSYCMQMEVSCEKINSKVNFSNVNQRVIERMEITPKAQPTQKATGLSALSALLVNIPTYVGLSMQKNAYATNKESSSSTQLLHTQSNDRAVKRIRVEFSASRDEQLRDAAIVKHHSKMEISKGEDDPTTLLKAGTSALKIGDYAKAKRWLKKLLEIREAEGKESVELADALHEMGSLYLSLGQYDEAAPLFLRALSLKEKKLTVEHPSGAKTRAKLGDLYKAKGEFGKAEAFYLRALAIYEKHSGLEEATVADIKMALGDIYLHRKVYDKAEKFFSQAVAINKKVRSINHPIIARLDVKLAKVFAANGDSGKAELFYIDSIDITKRSLGVHHTAYARAMKNLADFYKQNAQYKKAEKSYQKAISVANKAFGERHPVVAELLKNLSEVYEKIGDYAKAEAIRKKAIAAYR